MVGIDLLTVLACAIAPAMVWFTFHFSEACDDEECQPRRQIEDFVLPGVDTVPIALAAIVGCVSALHTCHSHQLTALS